MIDHTGITVSHFANSLTFYTDALAPLGHVVRKKVPDAAGFGSSERFPDEDPHGEFWIIQGEPFSPRMHIAFRATSVAQVDAFYAAAIKAGGRDNGAPGLRPKYHDRYYGAFVYDLDGYNIEAVYHGGQSRTAHDGPNTSTWLS